LFIIYPEKTGLISFLSVLDVEFWTIEASTKAWRLWKLSLGCRINWLREPHIFTSSSTSNYRISLFIHCLNCIPVHYTFAETNAKSSKWGEMNDSEYTCSLCCCDPSLYLCFFIRQFVLFPIRLNAFCCIGWF